MKFKKLKRFFPVVIMQIISIFSFALFFSSFSLLLGVEGFGKWQQMMSKRFDVAPSEQDKNKDDQNQILPILISPQGVPFPENSEIKEISITFSQPVFPMGKIVKNSTSLITISPQIKGEGYWKNTTTYCYRFDEPTVQSQTYDVSFSSYTAFSGKTIRQFNWSFSTPSIKIIFSHPENESRCLPLLPPIYVIFNQPVDPLNISKYIKLSTDKGPHPFTVTYRPEKEQKNDPLPFGRRLSKNKTDEKQAVIITPTVPFPVASDIRLTFLPGLPGLNGNLGLQTEQTLTFRTYEIFKITSVFSGDAEHTMPIICFSNTVKNSEEDLQKKLIVTPHIETKIVNKDSFYFNGGADNACFWIVGNFDLGKEYTLSAAPGIQDIFGNDLTGNDKKEYLIKLEGNYKKEFFPSSRSHFIVENYMKPLIPIDVTNIFDTDVFYKKLDIDDFKNHLNFNLILSNNSPHDIIIEEDKCEKFRWKIPILPNDPQTVGLDLGNLKITEPGYYYLRFGVTGTYYGDYLRPRQYVFQFTDTILVAKYSPGQIFVFPFNLKTGEPVPHLTFTIENFNNKNKSLQTTIGKIKGNNDGIAIFQPPKEIFENNNLSECFVFSEPNKGLITGEDNGDCGNFGKPEEEQDNLRYDDDKDSCSACEKHIPYGNYMLVFTDKFLYKPGQTVKFKAILRQSCGQALEIPKIKQVRVFLIGPDDKKTEQNVIPGNKFTAFGSFDGRITLPADTATGDYILHLTVDYEKELYHRKKSYQKEIRFQVEEYKPAKFEVKLFLDQKSLISGQTLTGKADAHYLFGTPLNNSRGYGVWQIVQAGFTPPGYENYSFGSCDFEPREIIRRTEIKLDENGIYKFEFSPLQLKETRKSSVRLNVRTDISDKDENRIGADESILIHRGEYYIGIKRDSIFQSARKPFKINIATVDPDGKPVRNKSLDFKISRETWKTLEIKDERGGWELKDVKELTEINHESLSLTGETLEKEISIEQPGAYIIEIQGKDNLNNTIYSSVRVYITGKGHAEWGQKKENPISIVTDKQKYNVGENVQVLIQSPYESATALVTVERERVMMSKVIRLTGNANTIRIPVEKEFMPNAFICVVFMKERTDFQIKSNDTGEGKPQSSVAFAEIQVEALEKKLNVQINKPQKFYKPGDKVDLDVSITDQNGKPVKSECCVSIVDKGVLNHVNYRLPNPFEYFWGPRGWGVKTVSNFYGILNFKLPGKRVTSLEELALSLPGPVDCCKSAVSVDMDDFSSPDNVLRKVFKESVFYSSFIQSNEKGKARISFTLGDDITTYVAMVVATGTDNRFGSGEEEILVRKELILSPAVPDFIRPNDSFSAGVTVTNDSKEKLNVSVQAGGENVQKDSADTEIKTISLNPGETEPVWFQFNASKINPGKNVKLFFKAAAGNSEKLTDGLISEIPVRLPNVFEAVADSGKVENAPVNQKIVVPSETLRDRDQLEIMLSSSAALGLKRNFQILQEYPYDCLEQRISKVIPLLMFNDFLTTFKFINIPSTEIDNRINGLLKILPQYKGSSYWDQFKYYPDSKCSSPYLTCYAVEFMQEARDRGYKIDDELLNNAEEALAKLIQVRNYWSEFTDRFSSETYNHIKAYAVYLLAKDRQYMPEEINRLYGLKNGLNVSSLSYLIKALDFMYKIPNLCQLTDFSSIPVPWIPFESMQQEFSRMILNRMVTDATTVHFENSADHTSYWTHESDFKTTACVLDTFLTVYRKFPYAEKIALWLTQTSNQKKNLSTQDHIFMFNALAKYFRVYEKQTPNFISQVLFNGNPILRHSFIGRDLTPAAEKIKLQDYQPNRNIDIAFKKDGKGILYYLYRMKTFPVGPVEALDRGFKVEKIYRRMDGTVVMDNTFIPGEKYTVEIRVETPRERSFVVLEDPVPAGFKIVNTNLATASKVDGINDSDDEWDEFSWDKFAGDFYRSEFYFDRVQVFAEYLFEGIHYWKYQVVATNKGNYSNPSTMVSEMYNPETFGRTANRNILVK